MLSVTNACRRTLLAGFAAGQRRAQSTIGFIGLGNMGSRMAANLVKKGKTVTVFDVSQEAMQELAKLGASTSSTVAELAQKSDIVITMLPATAHVQSVLTGPQGVLANIKPGSLIIDSSTIDPIASRQLIKEATDKGVRMIDAPVSGGVTGAEAGTLTFMVGGETADVERARDALSCMGKSIVHCGGPGAGEVTKLCNNLALAIEMIGVSEAMALGKKLGMDPKVLASVMNTSTSRCWSSDSYNPCPGVMEGVPASRGYTGGFGVALMEKDLGLAMDAAKPVKARLPLGAHAHQLYGLMSEHGYGNKDFSSVFEFLSKKH